MCVCLCQDGVVGSREMEGWALLSLEEGMLTRGLLLHRETQHYRSLKMGDGPGTPMTGHEQDEAEMDGNKVREKYRGWQGPDIKSWRAGQR